MTILSQPAATRLLHTLAIRHLPWLVAAALVLSGCTTGSETVLSASNSESCDTGQVSLDTSFPTGNVASCRPTSASTLAVTIAPEDAPPINCSAWYAFRLTPRVPQTVQIALTYEYCGHRYWPKTSVDGKNWSNLPQTAVQVYEVNGVKQATLTINLADEPVFVAGQEIISSQDYRDWTTSVDQSPLATARLLGQSAEGRDISALTIKATGSQPREQVVLIGRQHPPEVTGALAMQQFVETLLSNDPIAIRFRERFETTVVPLLNPDGVDKGYWRHNTGGIDLNRDWGPFSQPETRLMQALLSDIDADPEKQLAAFVDFHSTQRDIFYTIPDHEPTIPPLFIKRWLDRLQERMPDYPINRDANHNLTQATSKNYVYREYGVPTVTYEIGDETERGLIEALGTQSALAMMETLLDDQ